MRGKRNLFNIQGCRYILPTPPYLLALETTATDTARHDIVVTIIGNDLGTVEEAHLFHALLFHRTEVLLMGRTQ